MPYDWTKYTPRKPIPWYRKLDWGLLFACLCGCGIGTGLMWETVLETVKLLKQIVERL